MREILGIWTIFGGADVVLRRNRKFLSVVVWKKNIATILGRRYVGGISSLSLRSVSHIVFGYQGSVLGPAREGLFVTTSCQSGQPKGEANPNAFAGNAATGAAEKDRYSVLQKCKTGSGNTFYLQNTDNLFQDSSIILEFMKCPL